MFLSDLVSLLLLPLFLYPPPSAISDVPERAVKQLSNVGFFRRSERMADSMSVVHGFGQKKCMPCCHGNTNGAPRRGGQVGVRGAQKKGVWGKDVGR